MWVRVVVVNIFLFCGIRFDGILPPEIGGKKNLFYYMISPLGPLPLAPYTYEVFCSPLCQSVYHCGNPNKVSEDHRDRRYISTYHHLFDFAKHLMDKNVSDYLDMTNYEIIIKKNLEKIMYYVCICVIIQFDGPLFLIRQISTIQWNVYLFMFGFEFFGELLQILLSDRHLLFCWKKKIVEYGFRNNLVVLEITFLNVIFL